jgi:hypothetical protein
MTQVIAAVQEQGIAVATDSRASRLDRHEQGRRLNVKKLLPLGTEAFVVSAGLGVGVHLSHLFQEFIQKRGLARAEDILRLANPFFSRHYGEILSSGAIELKDERLDRVLLLIGGTPSGDPERPHRMILLASERGRVPFEQHEISSCITLPRSMAAEYQLHKMCEEHSSLEEILRYAHGFLLKRAEEDEDVAPPYYWGLLNDEGLKLGQWREEG